MYFRRVASTDRCVGSLQRVGSLQLTKGDFFGFSVFSLFLYSVFLGFSKREERKREEVGGCIDRIDELKELEEECSITYWPFSCGRGCCTTR